MATIYRRMLSVLLPGERRAFWTLVGVSAAVGLLEAIGVASILPFLAVASDPETALQGASGRALLAIMGSERPADALPWLAASSFLAIVAANVGRAGVTYLTVRTTRAWAHELGARLLARYLSHPYAWFLGRNTAHLGRSLLSEVQQIVDGVLAPAMRIIVNGAVAIFVVILLVALQPVAALTAAAIVGGAYGGVYALIKTRLKRVGVRRVAVNGDRFRLAQEATAGVKEVKMRNLEDAYAARYRDLAGQLARIQAQAALMRDLPQHFLQALGLGAIMLTIALLSAADATGFRDALPMLGAFAFAAVRLFPALQAVFAASAKLRFGDGALENLRRELTDEPPLQREGADAPPVRLERELRFERVSYRYPDAAEPALNDLDLAIRARTTVGVVGRTGAGKSTLIDVVMGLLTPQSGCMRVDGAVVGPDLIRGWRKTIGYVPQQIYLTDATVAENIAFGAARGEIDDDRVKRCAETAALDRFVATLPHGYETSVGDRGVRLSGGQRQRVGIARALYHDPDLLIFDEATSALDTVTEQAVMDAIARLGGAKTIILIAHRLSTVQACDTVFFLENGTVRAHGSYAELVRCSDGFRAMHLAAADAEA